jgi:hypothetical protein
MAALFNANQQIDPGQLGTMLIEENYQADDFRQQLGINVFEDVTWFNKEGFENTLFYGNFFFALESDTALKPAQLSAIVPKAVAPKTGAAKAKASGTAKAAKSADEAKTETTAAMPWLERIARIGELAEALEKAEEKSGYRLNELIDILAGTGSAKPVVKKAAGKSEAKPTAKKAVGKSEAKPTAKKPAGKNEAKPATKKAAGKSKKPAKGKKKE